MGATDIYLRKAYTKTYSPNTIEVNDTLEIFLQEIEMILTTPMTSVLGSVKFGASLDLYLHTLGTNQDDMKSRINEQIRRYSAYSGEYSWKVEVTFYKIGESETGVVDIIVEDDNLVRIILN
jgi:hypothetical protein